MARPKPDFKRMILGLPHSRQDYGAVDATAKLADLLGVDLVGTYFEDLSMLGLAELPSAREFRLGGWQRLDADQLAADFARAAEQAERLFAEVAGRRQRAASFRTGNGSAADAISSEASADDIIVIIEPKSPIERATRQFGELVEAAFRSSSSILLVPSLAMSASGPVIVVPAGPEDPCLDAALAVASAAGERMIVVPSLQSESSLSSIVETARLAGIATTVAPPAPDGGDDYLPAFIKGRLLIKRRPAAEERRPPSPPHPHMPVLLVSPRDPETNNAGNSKVAR